MTAAGTDHLLRTLAAVPIGSRILDFENDDKNRLSHLTSLGFEVVQEVGAQKAQPNLGSNGQSGDESHAHAPLELPLDDASFDWVIADRSSKHGDSLLHTLEVLAELRRVLKPGGWIYLVLPAGEAASEASDDECLLAFYKIAAEANFELAEAGVVEAASEVRFARAIFRRVESDTAA